MVIIPTLPSVEFAVPAAYGRVVELAYNLWWSWNSSGANLWASLDPLTWDRSHNPIELLASIESSRWQALEQLEAVQERYRTALLDFDRYRDDESNWYSALGHDLPGPVAYLCTEFGVHASVPFYSGGLGILAGDHLKSASDLGLPMVGVGLFYRRGYFRQEIDADGEQQHIYPMLEPRQLPIRPVAASTGGQLKVEVEFPGRVVKVAVWKLEVGRIPLLLLDTDIPENHVADRPITHMLYVRGREMRLCQELVLGLGAVRALEALGIEPAVWHINEGHAAMAVLELARRHMAGGLALEQARQAVRKRTVFTLHTPVPAGNEVFERSRATTYLGPWRESAGITEEELAHLGSDNGNTEQFDLGALAIRFASVVNGVSRRHGEVVTRDWQHLIGGAAGAITNGVHTPTWIGRDGGRTLTSRFGRNWPTVLLSDPAAVEKIGDLSDDEVWGMHQARKEIMINFARGRLRRQYARQGASPGELRRIDDLLPPDRLTLGFARRFATYKRATLMFRDPERLRAILTNPERPVQVVFAGKAHPADRQGQELIKQIHLLSRTPEFSGHVAVLEDYDARVARFLVQGADVWVNTPRPPMEASGTSGMKAAINGTINLSILDGWWVEGFDTDNGWAFGDPQGRTDPDAEDDDDASAFYDLLENEVIPLFYDREEGGISGKWVARMRASISSSLVAFSSHRMVSDYAHKAYFLVGSSIATT